jgi:signal transduction histidine kinase/CheY-like chemotaxis protein
MTGFQPETSGHYTRAAVHHEVASEGGTPWRRWTCIMLAELAIMMAATPLAIKLADRGSYGVAATILISSTLAAGSLVFALWRRQHLAKVRRLGEQKRLAERKIEEAEAQARQKSRQLATMSHEIRTPLNGVIGMLGLLLETELTAEQKNYAGTAHGSARSLLSFLDEILDTAKGEAQTGNLNIELELVPFIESITELMAPRAHAKGIDISAHISAALPRTLKVDQQKFRQILFNLVGNAIKFTEKGGVEVLVTRLDGTGLAVEVRDTGIGMTEAELERIFRDYTQANEDTSRRFGGTGLGLAISRGLAKSLGGWLTVESRKGHGSSFTFGLPLVLEEDGAGRERPLAGRCFGFMMPDGITRRHLQLTLQELGAAVEIFDEQSLTAYHRPLAGLLADVGNAMKLAHPRRSNRKLASIPMWVLLSPEERRGANHLLRAANTGYLVKPVRYSSLVTRLTERDRGPAGMAEDLRRLKAPARRAAKLRVLVVDDTPVNLLLAKTLLARAGHGVVAASSGQEALEIVASGEIFDCMLLDVEMPGLGGHETVRLLRKKERSTPGARHLPVIALTANTSAQDIAACMASGMDGHLAKPFDQLDLMDVLTGILRRAA